MAGGDLYHKAARDGYLDLLQEATRKDCDRPDEDGMTPTLWAAFHGNLDALRLLVGRGGNPDRWDHLGNTALHCAATKGHINCVSFLINFGVNLWALDNDFHTALDVAMLNNHIEVVRYLDDAIGTQTRLNKKLVTKLKEKAILDAQKRVKHYNKLREKAQRKAEKEDKKLAKESNRMIVSRSHSFSNGENSKFGTLRSLKSVNSTLGNRSTSSGFSEPKPYSAHFTSMRQKSVLGGVAKRIKRRNHSETNGDFKVGEVEMDGKRTIRSLAGLQRDPQIMYVRNGTDTSSSNGSDESGKRSNDNISRAMSVPDLNYNNDSGVDSSESSIQEPASMFERPGFGSVAFLSRPVVTDALLTLPSDSTDEDSQIIIEETRNSKRNGKIRRHGSMTDSIGTIGSLVARMQSLPWKHSDIDSDDDEIFDADPLHVFLAAGGVAEYTTLFTREKIDLAALMLLNDGDLKEIGLPMGPRRKILNAIAKRKTALKRPGVIMDTPL